jgi:hypothetical protein
MWNSARSESGHQGHLSELKFFLNLISLEELEMIFIEYTPVHKLSSPLKFLVTFDHSSCSNISSHMQNYKSCFNCL